MSPLHNILAEKINCSGPMSIDEYMSTCLYHHEHGYYTTRNPLGKDGDFTTAPEISPLFGEIIGAWIGSVWQSMGKPPSFNLVEVGPGQGTLMSDILRILQRVLPECYNASSINLVEISPKLTEIQKQTLCDHTCHWHSRITDTPNNIPILLIANEVLDAFPVRQFQDVDGQYFEKMVNLEDNKLNWTLGTTPHSFDSDQEIIETSSSRLDFLQSIKDHINTGAALIIDYGAKTTASYNSDTLQALHKHEIVDTLSHIGEADLTAHVNFNEVKKVLGETCSLAIPMGSFLTAIGLPVRANQVYQQLETEDEQKDLEQRLYRLLHPEEMGELFKVIGYRTPDVPELPALPEK